MKYRKWLLLIVLALPVLYLLELEQYFTAFITPTNAPKHHTPVMQSPILTPPPEKVAPVLIQLDSISNEILQKTHQLKIAKIDKQLRELSPEYNQQKVVKEPMYIHEPSVNTVIDKDEFLEKKVLEDKPDNNEKADSGVLSRLIFRGVIKTPQGYYGYISVDNQLPIRVTENSMIGEVKVISISDTYIKLKRGIKSRTIFKEGLN